MSCVSCAMFPGILRLRPCAGPAVAKNILPIAEGLKWPPPPSRTTRAEVNKEFLGGLHLKCIWIKGKNSIWVLDQVLHVSFGPNS